MAEHTNGAAPEGKPEFNLHGLPWREARKLESLRRKVEKAIADDDDEAVERFYTEIEKFYARIVVSVPRAWLIPSAPETIDWSDPEAFAYISGLGFSLLQKAAQAAVTPEETTKNSPAAS